MQALPDTAAQLVRRLCEELQQGPFIANNASKFISQSLVGNEKSVQSWPEYHHILESLTCLASMNIGSLKEMVEATGLQQTFADALKLLFQPAFVRGGWGFMV